MTFSVRLEWSEHQAFFRLFNEADAWLIDILFVGCRINLHLR